MKKRRNTTTGEKVFLTPNIKKRHINSVEGKVHYNN